MVTTDQVLFGQYAAEIRALDCSRITQPEQIPASLMLRTDGRFSVAYIPFEWVNTSAKLVIVGITPGFTQWKNAISEAQRQLRGGSSDEATLVAAQRSAAFSGPMRANLIALLDYFGLGEWLSLKSCEQLFGASHHLVQMTSMLRHPVFVNGQNYSGNPRIAGQPLLRRLVVGHFAGECRSLRHAVYVPLGPAVADAMDWLASEGIVDASRVLNGMPHPSGANVERIHYMTERKPRSELSSKTDPERLDRAREEIRAKIRALR
jgi:hypothetical protein